MYIFVSNRNRYNPKTADTELTAISVDNYAGTVIRG